MSLVAAALSVLSLVPAPPPTPAATPPPTVPALLHRAEGPDAPSPPALPDRVFPVRGPVEVSDGFGARGGSHKGVDLLADCGTEVVALRPGTVTKVAREGAAGLYVVVHGKRGDEVYMHLRKEGVRVGQALGPGWHVGEVGDTGRASACHLHLEHWTAPGWYAGGRATDPARILRATQRAAR